MTLEQLFREYLRRDITSAMKLVKSKHDARANVSRRKEERTSSPTSTQPSGAGKDSKN